MTQIRTAHIGSYPRIGESKDQQRHRRALSHLENKDISPHAFRDVALSVIQEVTREQIDAGMDEVTDGLVNWNDPVSYILSNVSGWRSGRKTRYYDLNLTYRVPVFTARPRRKEPLLAGDFRTASGVACRPVRPVVTGPYTMAANTDAEWRPLAGFPARLRFFTNLIAEEARDAAGDGATVIQIDEPALLGQGTDLTAAAESLRTIAKAAAPARLALAFSFPPPVKLLQDLTALPADILHLDFTAEPKDLLEALRTHPPEAAVGFGVANAYATRNDPIDPPLRLIRTWITERAPALVYITPSSGLEHIPRDNAFAKLRLIEKIRRECGHVAT